MAETTPLTPVEAADLVAQLADTEMAASERREAEERVKAWRDSLPPVSPKATPAVNC